LKRLLKLSCIKFEYKITIGYLLLGGAWILFSDMLLNALVNDTVLLAELQIAKGWFYVIITAIIFYIFIKQHLEQLRKARKKAQESDRLKTVFLQNISHEIRTPMNGIIGFTGLLTEKNLSEVQKQQYIEIINNSTNRLLDLVNKILDISLIESGNFSINHHEFELNNLMNTVFETIQHQSNPFLKITLSKDLNDKSDTILSDAQKIQQVLTHLLSNAIKFTGKGEISFGYKQHEDKLTFFVSDTGIGIDDDTKKTIFDRFTKPEASKTLYEGIGLGLAISKNIIKLMGGELWVESEVHKGSTFYFSVPYKQVIKTTEQDSEQKSTTQSKIPTQFLVAEDEDNNYLYIKSLLNRHGIDVIRANNGIEAVEICKTNSSLKAILMDIKMPEMNGYEAARTIKLTNPELLIIAQSAFSLDEESHGDNYTLFDNYIPKPFSREQLLSVLNHHKLMPNHNSKQ